VCAGCELDTSGCVVRPDCGDGRADPQEACDGNDLKGQTCASRGFDGGTLRCGAQCEFDSSGCRKCGNGVREAPEACDGQDIGDATCGSQAGKPRCFSNCTLDRSPCHDRVCGDLIHDKDEEECEVTQEDVETYGQNLLGRECGCCRKRTEAHKHDLEDPDRATGNCFSCHDVGDEECKGPCSCDKPPCYPEPACAERTP
jgi:hypothetical protein